MTKYRLRIRIIVHLVYCYITITHGWYEPYIGHTGHTTRTSQALSNNSKVSVDIMTGD